MEIAKSEPVPNTMGLATRFAGFCASTFATIAVMVLLA
ncbi:MAG: hypothetical protein JWQ36_1864 [Enterovirga sp.]|jgi:hypothetical protein|nr:hypothetical protein [Enterovirga sp.]